MKRHFLCLTLAFSVLGSFPIHAGPKYFVWNLGFCSTADVLPKVIPYNIDMGVFEERLVYDKKHYLKHIKDGSLVWVQADHLVKFINEVVPKIKGSIFLISGGSDATFPNDYPNDQDVIDAINSGKIIHLFLQNCAYKHKRVSQIPIGMDLHTSCYWPERHGGKRWLTPKKQLEQLNRILTTLKPTSERKIQAVCDFAFNDSMHGIYNRFKEFGEDRKSIWKSLESKEFVTHLSKHVPRTQLWQMKGQCAFDISPPGNGLDCHRTWESLMLGCIVIVKDSFLNPLYEGLPIVIVKSWDEITDENLQKWHKQYGDAFTNPEYREKLMLNYWLDITKKMQLAYFHTSGFRKEKWTK